MKGEKRFLIVVFTIILRAELTRERFGKYASEADGAEVG